MSEEQRNECPNERLVISVRQPWAWLIINGGKDIENRSWPTKVRGRVFIHASKTVAKSEAKIGVNAVVMLLRVEKWIQKKNLKKL